MAEVKKVHHANDVTNVYFTNVIPEILHKYFRLPGKFVRNYTTRIVKRDGSEGEMDWLILVEPDNYRLFEKILINVEFQSSRVTPDKIEKIAEYKDYAKTYYGLPVLTVIIITDGYESSQLEYSRVPSDILKPIYIYIDWEEIKERLNSIEEKIDNHKQLSDDDALDMVYIPMFSPKNKAEWITEKMTHLFNNDTSLKRPFRDYIGYGLSLMVKKYFNVSSKAEELLNMLDGNVDNSKLRIVAEFEDDYAKRVFEHKLAKMGKTISEMDKAIAEKNSAISEMDKAIAEKDSTIAEKDSTINKMNKAIADKDNQNKIMLEEKEHEINILKAKLKENGISYK